MCLNRSFAFKFPLLLKKEANMLYFRHSDNYIMHRDPEPQKHFSSFLPFLIPNCSSGDAGILQAADYFYFPTASVFRVATLNIPPNTGADVPKHSGSTVDFSQYTGKDARSFTYPILHVSVSTHAVLHKLAELLTWLKNWPRQQKPSAAWHSSWG